MEREAYEYDPPCSCGRPSRIIYITEMFGDVPHCGIDNARPLPSRVNNPRWVARWREYDV